MKSLVLHPEFQLYERKDKAFCSSLQVAYEFEKRHSDVLRDIRNLDCSEDFYKRNFAQIRCPLDLGQGRTRQDPMYLMTRDGFMFLCFGYRGDKAAAIKEAYIARFNAYEEFIRKFILSRDEFLPFTRAIEFAHDEPKSYHYSNECDMINRLILGCTAKQYKAAHGIPVDTPSIRPYLAPAQSKAIRALQNEDIPLLYQKVGFQERKTILAAFTGQLSLS